MHYCRNTTYLYRPVLAELLFEHTEHKLILKIITISEVPLEGNPFLGLFFFFFFNDASMCSIRVCW